MTESHQSGDSVGNAILRRHALKAGTGLSAAMLAGCTGLLGDDEALELGKVWMSVQPDGDVHFAIRTTSDMREHIQPDEFTDHLTLSTGWEWGDLAVDEFTWYHFTPDETDVATFQERLEQTEDLSEAQRESIDEVGLDARGLRSEGAEMSPALENAHQYWYARIESPGEGHPVAGTTDGCLYRVPEVSMEGPIASGAEIVSRETLVKFPDGVTFTFDPPSSETPPRERTDDIWYGVRGERVSVPDGEGAGSTVHRFTRILPERGEEIVSPELEHRANSLVGAFQYSLQQQFIRLRTVAQIVDETHGAQDFGVAARSWAKDKVEATVDAVAPVSVGGYHRTGLEWGAIVSATIHAGEAGATAALGTLQVLNLLENIDELAEEDSEFLNMVQGMSEELAMASVIEPLRTGPAEGSDSATIFGTVALINFLSEDGVYALTSPEATSNSAFGAVLDLIERDVSHHANEMTPRTAVASEACGDTEDDDGGLCYFVAENMKDTLRTEAEAICSGHAALVSDIEAYETEVSDSGCTGSDGDSVSESDCTIPSSQNYPQFGFDARNTVYNPDASDFEDPGSVPTQLWTHSAENEVESKPVLYEGVLYVSAEETLIAYDACNGSVAWDAVFESPIYSVAAGHGSIYVGLVDGAGIKRISPESGEVEAKSAVEDHVFNIVVQEEGVSCYLTDNRNDHRFLRFTPGLVEERRFSLGRFQGSLRPAITGDRAVFGGGKVLQGYDHDGELVWGYGSATLAYVNRPPTIHRGHVYQGMWTNGDKQFVKIALHDGEIVASRDSLDYDIHTTPVIREGDVHVGTDEGVRRYDTELGDDTLFEADSQVHIAPVVTEERIYAVTSDDRVHAWDRDSASQLWSMRLSADNYSHRPILAGGVLFITSETGITSAYY